jgi:hypothetical protein
MGFAEFQPSRVVRSRKETTGASRRSFLRQFGRGSVGAGYESKLRMIEKLNSSHSCQYLKPVETIFGNINAVPLDYSNN